VATVTDRGGRAELPHGSSDDRWSILDTLHAYCHALDYGDLALGLSCFTEDGTIEFRLLQDRSGRRAADGGYRVGPKYETHEGITSFLAGHSSAPTKYHKHFVLNTRIAFRSDDQATSVSYMLRCDDLAETSMEVYAFGRYHDQLIRESDRAWRIAHRIIEVEALHPSRLPTTESEAPSA
jgi:hypothetical protein